MRKAHAAVLAVLAVSCAAAASALGVPYRVANLDQGQPEYPDAVGFLGALGDRALVLKKGNREDADEQGHSQAELWSAEPTSGAAEPLAGFADVNVWHPEVIGALNGRLLFRLDGYSQVWTTDGTRAGTTPLNPALYSPFDNAIGCARGRPRSAAAPASATRFSPFGTPAGADLQGSEYSQTAS